MPSSRAIGPAYGWLDDRLREAIQGLAGQSEPPYVNAVNISFDPKKREAALEERGLDFKDAVEVFEGDVVLEYEDTRRDYGEVRMTTIGYFKGRMVVVCWTQRGGARHVFSMRKANEREQARFGQRSRKG